MKLTTSNPYLSLFRIRFINNLQYRTAALAGLATQFVWGLMQLLAFKAFYTTNPHAFPMLFEHTVAYIWLQQAFLALFMMWFYEMDIFDLITNGNVAYELSRPIDIYWKWFMQTLASRSSKAVLRCMPVLILAFLVPKPYRLILPDSFLQFVLFVVSMLLGLLVVVSFSMLVYISSFYTISSQGIRIMVAALSDFLAGALIPLPFFPDRIKQFISFLPFASMQSTPLLIYSGHISGYQLLKSLTLQVFWLVALLVIGRILMASAIKKTVVQGG